jgi:hypothetical protein
MLTAETVYKVAIALSKEELRCLYAKIGKDLNSDTNSLVLNKKPPKTSKTEVRNYLLTHVFKVDINK